MPRVLNEEKPAELNMTPMIDVVFQLLIFFMLTMHFKEIEGKLITTLPKDKGMAASSALTPEQQEVRIILCAGGDVRMHAADRAEHDKAQKNPAVCQVQVDRHDCGRLFMTESDPTRAAANREVYKRVGGKAKELYDMLPSSRDPGKRTPVVVDADSETPYEHIVGVVDALKARDIENIEFAGNLRLGRK